MRDLHRLDYLNEAARRGLGNNAGLIDCRDKGRCTPVHDRNFRAVDLDGGIIDAHAAQGCEHMLGGRNQRTIPVAKHGRKFGGDDRFSHRLHFAAGTIHSGTDKNKTCIDWCRSKGQAYG